jgi:hypothetical protein
MEKDKISKPKFLLIKDERTKNIYKKVDNETRVKLIEMV